MNQRQTALALLLICLLAPWTGGETITNLKDGKKFSGRILYREQKDGRERFVFESAQEKLGWLWANEWEVTGSGGVSNQPAKLEQPLAEPLAPDPYLTEVEVTGFGLTPDQAEQHAYNVAIERAVGVLVDAETLIENDQIIHDKVLTFSKGFIEKFEVGRTWQEEGLHYISARAAVRVSEIIGKLETSHVQVRPIAGHDERLRILQELHAESNAADMFKNIMQDYRLDKVGKVTIEGKPKTVSRDSTHAKLRIETKVEVDMTKYQTFVRKLRPLLQKVATKKTECTFQGPRLPGRLKSPSAEDLFNRLSGEGRIVALLRDINISATRVQYDMFRVPASFEGTILDARQQKYCLNITLLDSSKNVLQANRHDLTTRHAMSKWVLPLSHDDVNSTSSFSIQLPTAWIVPFLYCPQPALFVTREVDLDVPLETLDQTSHYAVAIEEVEAEDKRSSRPRTSGTIGRL